ncbi:Planctomycete cytochrome C [Pirellula sp. SH-Sr6A]|uniref:DUF2231 domain-containing protein n=1 Tax=Pirellula sp. SH-Sr6A TaxID=1632865 RepID=UPI00078BE66C|nr:DUF2231 domain-containing protein [Pirellula sp. SH-Sr6A]AMV31469.1 Planctomycete cytochrome C [Pirellula sp. SH-Sr6A]
MAYPSNHSPASQNHRFAIRCALLFAALVSLHFAIPTSGVSQDPPDASTAEPVPAGTTEPQQETEPKKGIVDFAKDIAPLLKSECFSCHQGEKAKGGFEVGDREAVLGYIEPGDASASSLWTDYLIQPSKTIDTESLVMPPDGPMAPQKLALLKLWIDEGAIWPDGVTLGVATDAASPVAPVAPVVGGSFWQRSYRAIGYFHPAVVHFPIALFIVAGVCSFLSYFLGKRCESMAFHCLWIATLSTIAAVVMGWSFADQRGYPAWNQSLGRNASHEEMTLFYHRWVGSLMLLLSLVVVIIGLFSGRGESTRLRNFWKVGAMLLALMVSIVGHQGGELVYGEIFDKAMEQFSK